MSIENKKLNPGTFDTKKLLDGLLDDISIEYGLDKSSIEKLLISKSIKDLNSLKKELETINSKSNNEKLNNSKLEKLFFTISGAKEVIEKATKKEIDIIKEELENIVNFEDFINYLEEYLPKNIVNSAKNSKNLHEHILGASLGISNSVIKTVDILYQIGKGTLKIPYHLYLIISGKGEYTGFKDI